MVPTWCRHGADMRRSGGISMQAKVTKRVVDGAPPRDATYLVRDSEVKGFVLVVTPAGAKSYAVDYRAGSGRGAPKRRLPVRPGMEHATFVELPTKVFRHHVGK